MSLKWSDPDPADVRAVTYLPDERAKRARYNCYLSGCRGVYLGCTKDATRCQTPKRLAERRQLRNVDNKEHDAFLARTIPDPALRRWVLETLDKAQDRLADRPATPPPTAAQMERENLRWAEIAKCAGWVAFALLAVVTSGWLPW